MASDLTKILKMFAWFYISIILFLTSTESKKAGQDEMRKENTAFYEYVEDTDGWLRLHIVPVTWQQARVSCHLEGGTLTSPTTTALTRAMKNMLYVHKLAHKYVFTGIHTPLLKGDFITVDGVPLQNISLQWAADEPNNVGNNEECVVMTGDGELADVDCASLHPFFCYINNSRMCDSLNKDYLMEPRTGSCYKVHRERRSWISAALACSKERAHLAVINSDKEKKALVELLVKKLPMTIALKEEYSKKMAHIGMWDEFQNGNWTTIFGETDDWRWQSGEPKNGDGKEYCGGINRQGLLYDSPCTGQDFPFICEINT